MKTSTTFPYLSKRGNKSSAVVPAKDINREKTKPTKTNEKIKTGLLSIRIKKSTK